MKETKMRYYRHYISSLSRKRYLDVSSSKFKYPLPERMILREEGKASNAEIQKMFAGITFFQTADFDTLFPYDRVEGVVSVK